jgi:hypothetical protein
MNLFDFDFSDENNGMMTEQRIAEQFKVLQGLFKDRMNAHFMAISDLPANMKVYIDEFEKRGWIVRRGYGVNIPDEHLLYHTPEEIINEFKERVDTVISQSNISWYEDVLPVINSGSMPLRYKNESVREQINQMRYEVIKETAFKFGLKHFIEVPSSRGHKMNPISSKWAKKNVLPLIAELVIPITDFDDMKNFFRTSVFFMGRRDWDRSGYAKNYDIPPYPEFRRLSPSYFELACLCEAVSMEHVKLILDYSGSIFGHHEKEAKKLKYIYPEGWSYKKYEESLTEKDKEIIAKDKERLKRLHSHKL